MKDHGGLLNLVQNKTVYSHTGYAGIDDLREMKLTIVVHRQL